MSVYRVELLMEKFVEFTAHHLHDEKPLYLEFDQVAIQGRVFDVCSCHYCDAIDILEQK